MSLAAYNQRIQKASSLCDEAVEKYQTALEKGTQAEQDAAEKVVRQVSDISKILQDANRDSVNLLKLAGRTQVDLQEEQLNQIRDLQKATYDGLTDLAEKNIEICARAEEHLQQRIEKAHKTIEELQKQKNELTKAKALKEAEGKRKQEKLAKTFQDLSVYFKTIVQINFPTFQWDNDRLRQHLRTFVRQEGIGYGPIRQRLPDEPDRLTEEDVKYWSH